MYVHQHDALGLPDCRCEKRHNTNDGESEDAQQQAKIGEIDRGDLVGPDAAELLVEELNVISMAGHAAEDRACRCLLDTKHEP
jgi:hypothetical protein